MLSKVDKAKPIVKKVSVGIISGAVAFSIMWAWYYITPRVTLWRMNKAIESRDDKVLVSYLDIPAMRKQMRRSVAADLKAVGRHGGVAMDEQLMVELLVGKTIDRLISDEGIRAATHSRGNLEDEVGELEYEIRQVGFNHFYVKVTAPARVLLRFGRRGMGWKLEGIESIPQGPKAIIA